MLVACEIDSSVEGSAAAIGARSREAFASVHVKRCACRWALRLELGCLVECATCGAPIYVRRAA
jgi:hypothetical protein